jgi:hypothetical protein
MFESFPMSIREVSPQIVAAARNSESLILQSIAKLSQTRVAALLGVAPSTVHRTDKMEIAMFLAACGLKAVSASARTYDPEYIASLKVLAGVGLQAPPPEVDEIAE